MIDTLLELLLGILDKEDISTSMRESCGIAVSRIALKADLTRSSDDGSNEAIIEIRKRIPVVIFHMLDSENVSVLASAIGCARALGQRGIFKDIFSSDTFYTKVASIVARHRNEDLLMRMCCAVLAVFSYDSSAQTGLSDEAVMNVLFTITKSDDILIKKLVATTLCNMSVSEESCTKLVDRKVVDVLGTLSGATSEMIQELCAKCVCNLTCVIRLHSTIINQNILQIILMIALVRSVGTVTKKLCAISLLNLISDENMPALCSAGAIRVFGTLCSSNDQVLRNICARGFLLFTTKANRCEELIQRRAVVQALFSMVKSKSSKARVLVGLSVCNLLSVTSSQKIAISTGALSVLKILCTLPYDDLKEAIARVVISILQVSSLHIHLTTQPIAGILTMMVQQSKGFTFDCAVNALACMSQYEIFRNILIDKGAVAVLVNAVMNGSITSTSTAEAVCRCLCFLSYTRDRSEIMIKQGHLIFGLHALRKTRHCNDMSAKMMAIIIRNLSFDSNMRKYIVHQDGVGFLWLIMRDFPNAQQSTYTSGLLTLYNLSLETSLHQELIEQGFVDILYHIVLPTPPVHSLARSDSSVTNGDIDDEELVKSFDINSPIAAKKDEITTIADYRPLKVDLSFTPVNARAGQSNVTVSTDDIIYITKAIELVSQTKSCCKALVDGNIIDVIYDLYNGLTDESRLSTTLAIVNISALPECRAQLVELGTCDLLIKLSNTSNPITQSKCSVALAYLSDITTIHEGVVQSMLALSLKGATSNDSLADTIRDAIIKANQNQQASKSSMEDYSTAVLVSPDSKRIRDMMQDGFRKRQDSNISFVKRVISEYRPNQPTISFFDIHDEGTSSNVDSILIDGELNKNYMLMEQTQMYGNFDTMCYVSVPFNVPVESGGTADEFDIQFSMPSLSVGANGSLPLPDRAADMMKVPMPMEALPKDCTMHTESSIATGFMNSFMLDTSFNVEDKANEADKEAQDKPIDHANKGPNVYSLSNLKSSTKNPRATVRSPSKGKLMEPGSLLKLGSTSAKILKKHSFYRLGRSYSFAKENPLLSPTESVNIDETTPMQPVAVSVSDDNSSMSTLDEGALSPLPPMHSMQAPGAMNRGSSVSSVGGGHHGRRNHLMKSKQISSSSLNVGK
jgi:hypothetical protein